jgi:hypothetical protein
MLVWPSAPALADGIVGVPGQAVQGIMPGTPTWWSDSPHSDSDPYRTLRFGITLSNVSDSILYARASFKGYLPDGNIVACSEPWSQATILANETAYVGCDGEPSVHADTMLDQVTFRLEIEPYYASSPAYEVTQAPNLTKDSFGAYHADTRIRAVQSDLRSAMVLFRFYDAGGMQVATCDSETVWDLEPEASRRIACTLGVRSPEPDPQIAEVRVTTPAFSF